MEGPRPRAAAAGARSGAPPRPGRLRRAPRLSDFGVNSGQGWRDEPFRADSGGYGHAARTSAPTRAAVLAGRGLRSPRLAAPDAAAVTPGPTGRGGRRGVLILLAVVVAAAAVVAIVLVVNGSGDGADDKPTNTPTSKGAPTPSLSLPSGVPTELPSELPTSLPSNLPSGLPTEPPSGFPSDLPSELPDLPTEFPGGILPSAANGTGDDVPFYEIRAGGTPGHAAPART